MINKVPKFLITAFVIALFALNIPFASAAPAVQVAADETIVDIASSNEQLTTLNTALQLTGLVDTLSQEGPYTVFAPTDAAFEALPDGMLDNLMANTGSLEEVLLYHVVNDTITADDISDGLSATTVQGATADFTVGESSVMIGDANIVETDIMAFNGVIHLIDTVLLPPVDPAPSEVPSSEEVIVACAVDYVVQADDWLSRLADRYYGDPLLYPVIFEATNEAAAADETYVTIEDADVIEIGQTLCVPAEAEAQAIMTRITENIAAPEADDTGAMTDTEAMTGTEELPIPGEMAEVEEPVENVPPVETEDDGEAMVDVTEPNGTDLSNLTVVDLAAQDGRFNTLVEALQSTGLAETLEGVGPFTVFAPTDTAFEALSDEALANLAANPDEYRSVLLYHVVEGQQLTAAEVTATSTLTTAQGSTADVTVDGETVMIGTATVTQPDIQASNGIIHVIDQVLLQNE